jgi:hypothetical protein
MRKRRIRTALVVVVSVVMVAVGFVNADVASAKDKNPFRVGKGSCAGYAPIGNEAVGKKTTLEVYWNESTKTNCVMLRNNVPDKNTKPFMILTVSNDTAKVNTDIGKYAYYAGPLKIKAPNCLWITAEVGKSAASKNTTYQNRPGSGKYGC